MSVNNSNSGTGLLHPSLAGLAKTVLFDILLKQLVLARRRSRRGNPVICNPLPTWQIAA